MGTLLALVSRKRPASTHKTLIFQSVNHYEYRLFRCTRELLGDQYSHNFYLYTVMLRLKTLKLAKLSTKIITARID